MSTLLYRTGDATAPDRTTPVVIAHICNDLGRWGSGFVLAVSERWPTARDRYLAWAEGRLPDAPPFELGRMQPVRVEPGLWVANMIAQHGVGRGPSGPPIRYDALETALSKVATFATGKGAGVHMPRIGAARAGGDWARIEEIIERTVVAAGVPVQVYDLPRSYQGRSR